MSAFVVSDKHINSLLTWANINMDGINLPDGDILSFKVVDDLQKLAQILLDENYKSVNYRYNRNDSETIEFHFTPVLTPVEILKACECFDYQACETNDYKESAAYRIIDWIKGSAIGKLPGYESAAWEIE